MIPSGMSPSSNWGTTNGAVGPAGRHNLDAERGVLGAVLLANRALSGVLVTGLQTEHFYGPQHQEVFAAMVALHERGAGIDTITVAEELWVRGRLDTVGGEAGIDDLCGSGAPAGTWVEYARIVLGLAHQRARIAAAWRLATAPADPAAWASLVELYATPTGSAGAVVTAREFLAIERVPTEPYVHSGRSGFLSLGSGLLIAGPSGCGKTLAVLDLAGLLASERGGRWLGLDVAGGLRVLCVLLEGTDDENRYRIEQLVPEDARERLFVVDRWRHALPPAGELPAFVASCMRRHGAQVLLIDTLAAFCEGRYDTSKGIPEAAHQDFERMRHLAQIDFASVATAHTIKVRDRTPVDELEELAGSIHKKADAAITLRTPERESTNKREVRFAKNRSGPPLPGVRIATLPDEDSDEPPRLTIVGAAGGRPVKQGTEAERIADHVRCLDGPIEVAVLRTELGGLSDSTLRRRRPDLQELGITHGKLPGRGNTHAYGTVEQWQRASGLGEELGA